jgi:uncharacterized protein (TIGR03083 family)
VTERALAGIVAAGEAFRVESARLADVMSGLDEADFGRPTACPPWTVRDLLAHVCLGAGRLLAMLGQPAPPRAEVDAAGYFGREKFTPDVDAARVASAQQVAAQATTGHALAAELDRLCRAVDAAVAVVAPDRVVRTRHGDAMTVDDFLVTRVVELGVHGLDLAAALGRRPWLSDQAAAVIADLLSGGRERAVCEPLSWDRRTFIAKATGRARITDAERARLERLGLRWLSLG